MKATLPVFAINCLPFGQTTEEEVYAPTRKAAHLVAEALTPFCMYVEITKIKRYPA
jgi:hypothetical protein